MRIDLILANEQARQILTHSNNVRDARFLLLSFQRDLNQRWRGQEVDILNEIINSVVNRLALLSDELGNIAADIKF